MWRLILAYVLAGLLVSLPGMVLGLVIYIQTWREVRD